MPEAENAVLAQLCLVKVAVRDGNTSLPYRQMLCLLLACSLSGQEHKMFALATCSKAVQLVCPAKCSSLPRKRRQIPLQLVASAGEF